MPGTVLIVDDDPVQRRLVEAALSKGGYQSVSADSGEDGLARLESGGDGAFSVIILDLVMPGMGGIEFLDALRERDIGLPVIVLTAQGGIDTVVAAMRRGAFDFAVKPVSPERIQKSVADATKLGDVQTRVRHQRRGAGGGLTFRDIVTRDARMERLIAMARKAGATDIPVLVEGESGVGKELVARAIQAAGDRRTRPFVAVNCGAIPENLVESILFGHEKGAFTGATERRAGKFQEAHSGTLFLDEVGELPPNAQVKLLRALQDGEIDPVGARSSVKVDIRLVSATNRDLLQRVKDGLFREDLYYRLNVFPITVPPLRERRADIPLLVQHFMTRLTPDDMRGRIRGISQEALALLGAYDWPGNIRQLENAVFRAIVLSEGSVLTADEFPQIRSQVDGIALGDGEGQAGAVAEPMPEPALRAGETGDAGMVSAIGAAHIGAADSGAAMMPGTLSALDAGGEVRALAEIELEMIQLAIARYRGQMSEVARRLGIGRSTLYRKLKEYGIDPEEGRSERWAS